MSMMRNKCACSLMILIFPDSALSPTETVISLIYCLLYDAHSHIKPAHLRQAWAVNTDEHMSFPTMHSSENFNLTDT